MSAVDDRKTALLSNDVIAPRERPIVLGKSREEVSIAGKRCSQP
jgi:hypothetical protein